MDGNRAGRAPRVVAGLVVGLGGAVLGLTGCAGPGRTVPPVTTGRAPVTTGPVTTGGVPVSGSGSVEPTRTPDRPPAMPDPGPVTAPAPEPVVPQRGSRARTASWRLAGREDGGRVLLLDVGVGGPPCDAVTGLDVSETAEAVTVVVHAGATTGARCPEGVSLRLGTARLRVGLRDPLGRRSLSDPTR